MALTEEKQKQIRAIAQSPIRLSNFPDMPRIQDSIEKNVLTISGAKEFDSKLSEWWTRVQHILEQGES